MARVFTATKSKRGKRIACRKCGKCIKPGERYFFYTRRFSRSKKVRGTRFTHCKDHRPRHADLSGSPMAGIYDAQEDAHHGITYASTGPKCAEVMGNLLTVIEEVKEQAESSLENMPEALKETSESGQALTERIEALESYISEIEQARDDADGDEQEGENLEDTRDACETAIDSLSI